MEIYLDHAATTFVYPEVTDIMCKVMREDFGNPSSMHRKGFEAEKYIKETTKILSGILKCSEKEIYYTSGGTESNNWALIGAAMANARRGRHIITTEVEHSAVSAPLSFLEEQGFEITKIGTDKSGRVEPETLKQALRDDTILVSVMAVNNEIGSVMPLEELGKVIKEKDSAILFHIDAIQAFGKMELDVRKIKADMLSVSSHKIHGPKGAGFLYIKDKTKIRPLIYGGGQQNGYRSGTDNVPGIAGTGIAAKLMYGNLKANREHMYAVKKQLADGISGIENVRFNGPDPSDTIGGAPHVLNVSFTGIRSEVLLHALEDKGIYVSSGSACSSHKKAISATLSALGCSQKEIDSSIRFSFCEATTSEEIEETIRALNELVPMLRRYTRR